MEKLSLIARQPVRVYIYSVVVAIVSALVVIGKLTDGVASVVLTVGASLLAVPAVEAARRKVVPEVKLGEVAVQDVEVVEEPEPVEAEGFESPEPTV